MKSTVLPSASTFPAPLIRQPRQKRSKERFEAILDSAERLLQTQEPHDISIYTIADEAGISPPSIYHFFADADGVFFALAERYYRQFAEGYLPRPTRYFASWQELWDFRSSRTVEFYNQNPAPRKLLLGSGLSSAMRARDLVLNRELAELSCQDLNHYFVAPDLKDLIDRMTETLVLTDALWTLSVHVHGVITKDLEEQARRARTAYARTFLPEYLPPRDADPAQPASP